MTLKKCENPNCLNFGKEYKNLGAHRCKPKENPIIETPTNPTIPPKETLKKHWWNFGGKGIKYPKKLLSTSEIREMKQIRNSENLTDEQKFLRFFGNLQKWVIKKPGFFTRLRMGANIRHVVFVSPDRKTEDTEAWIPYNKDLGLLQTDNDFYDYPVNEKGTIYLNAKKFVPVIDGVDYSKEFDIPEDFAISLISRGIGYGQLAQFKSLINELQKDRMIKLVCMGLVALAFVVLFLVVYSDNKALKIMADQIGNITQR